MAEVLYIVHCVHVHVHTRNSCLMFFTVYGICTTRGLYVLPQSETTGYVVVREICRLPYMDMYPVAVPLNAHASIVQIHMYRIAELHT